MFFTSDVDRATKACKSFFCLCRTGLLACPGAEGALRARTGQEACPTKTRRAFFQALGAAAILGVLTRRRASGETAQARLNWESPLTPSAVAKRRYRVDAQVIVLAMPFFRRAGVGAGSAAWIEQGLPDSALRLLEFEGYSDPKRAGGLQRLGFIRELSRLSANGAAESIYFGLMTAAPEESAEEARKTLRTPARDLDYAAIDGRVFPGSVETVTAHFTAPSVLSAEQRRELVELAQRALSGAPRKAAPPTRSDMADQPFLQTLADMLRRPAIAEAPYTYSGRRYRLKVRREPDPKSAAYFTMRGLLRPGCSVTRVSGTLRRETGGRENHFRLWMDDGAGQPVPLRIEYQPKSYLRLIFEAVGE